MKKVINTENIEENEAEKSRRIIRGLKAAYLALLIAAGAVAAKNIVDRVSAKEPVNNDTEVVETVKEETNKEKKANVYVDGIKVEVIKGENVNVYAGPEGYTYDPNTGLCYRLSTKGETPKGYKKAEDGETLIPIAEELESEPIDGYIQVGNKYIEFIEPTRSEIKGQIFYSLPEGYMLADGLGYKVIVLSNDLTNVLR